MKIIVNGAGGRMGGEVVRLLSERGDGNECIAKVDPFCSGEGVFSSLFCFSGSADVVIDFSHHSQTEELLRYTVERRLSLVIATTGQDEEEIHMIRQASGRIPIFLSANMSVGIAVFVKLAQKIARMFPDADIEIVEAHHRRKADSPSGTALMIAEAVREERLCAAMDEGELVFGRRGHAIRRKGEIGIHSIRAGNIVGMHEVIASAQSQTIVLRHETHSRTLYAEGAISAAQYLIGKPAGLYNMYDMLDG